MDDVDAVQAQIARTMLASGDWVTARLDGVAYLEKSPLVYWMMAGSYRIFGVHDWAARLPLALAAVLLCWVTYRFGRWAFSEAAGIYAGLSLATCVGLYLFTRILIPDATLTLTIALAIWAAFRLLEDDEPSPHRWFAILGIAIALGVLLKGLIAIIFPLLAILAYMGVTRQIGSLAAWKRLRLWLAIPLCMLIAAPWHVLATLHNPPYFVFSMHSGPGDYRGFFWFYFFNEHLLRFLNLRYPHDYNTVPRPLFWALNLVWIFPWTGYLIAAARQSFSKATRAGRTRLLALCWIGAVMVFFTFSTTQEYYSMPIYPALALLVGSAMAEGGRWVAWATRATAAFFLLLFGLLSVLLLSVWSVSTHGQMWNTLTQNPALYTLSLGHLADLTFKTFAFLKLPLGLAALAFGMGAFGLWLARKNMWIVALTLAGSM
ncbi:MAG: ArnT family glycosyltransferase, partial [Acidobacteriaceae bacterium]